MRRVLLLLAKKSYRAEAFLRAAARIGVEVTVGSDHRAALQSLAPDANLTLDFADPGASVLRIEAAARSQPFDAVVAAEDQGAILAAAAANALGLRHASVEAVLAARDKASLRRHMAAAGLPVPEFTLVEPTESIARAAARVPYPCVIKPLSLSASRGVIRADDAAGFEAALVRVRRIVASVRPKIDARLLVESFLPGREVALEGVLHGGRLETFALMDKPDPLDGPFFEETLLVTPSRLSDPVQSAVVAHAQEVAGAIGLTEGPVHAELRVDVDRVRLLELAPRSIGGKCSRILRFDNDAGLEEVLLHFALGDSEVAPHLVDGASGVLMLPIPRRGTLQGVDGQARARMVPHIEGVDITAPPGAEVMPPPEGSSYLGFVFARAETPDLVEKALRDAHRYLVPDIEPLSSLD